MKYLKYLIPIYGLIKLLDARSDIDDWDPEMVWGVLLIWYHMVVIGLLVYLIVKGVI